jgi:CheY-like chemotaxis protein
MRAYTIIIVENDEDEQFFIRESIKKGNLFKILAQVKEGGELLDWLKSHPTITPDIILSDLNMPGKNGYDILVEIKSNPAYLHIPVIITSTSSTKTTIDKCLALGAKDFIEKPDTFVNYVPFLKQLHRLIEEKHIVKK